MYMNVGCGNPLTALALPPPPPLLPSEPEADELAPGNGVMSDNPLVVTTMIPRLAIAKSARSSSTQLAKSGRNIKRLFILAARARPQSGIRWLPL
jgi:hypothetical protein